MARGTVFMCRIPYVEPTGTKSRLFGRSVADLRLKEPEMGKNRTAGARTGRWRVVWRPYFPSMDGVVAGLRVRV